MSPLPGRSLNVHRQNSKNISKSQPKIFTFCLKLLNFRLGASKIASRGLSASVLERLGASWSILERHRGVSGRYSFLARSLFGVLGVSRGPFRIPKGRPSAPQGAPWTRFGHHFRDTMRKSTCGLCVFLPTHIFERFLFDSRLNFQPPNLDYTL